MSWEVASNDCVITLNIFGGLEEDTSVGILQYDEGDDEENDEPEDAEDEEREEVEEEEKEGEERYDDTQHASPRDSEHAYTGVPRNGRGNALAAPQGTADRRGMCLPHRLKREIQYQV